MKNAEEDVIVKENLSSAVRGKAFYKKIVKNIVKPSGINYLQEDIPIILFPSRKQEVNHYGMLYLDEFLLRNLINRAVVLYTDDYVEKHIENMVNTNILAIRIKQIEMNDLLMYYRLIEFNRRIVVISLELPLGRNGEMLLQSEKISIEQLVAVGMYKLIPFCKIKAE